MTAEKQAKIWQEGDLFHRFNRAAIDHSGQSIDRLGQILMRGIIAPGSDPQGLVVSDLRITVVGAPVPYDKFIFLHRMGQSTSPAYTMPTAESAFIFVNRGLEFLEPEQMGPDWPVLSQDEVYVRDYIEPEDFTALAVHKSRVTQVHSRYRGELDSLKLPLFDTIGRRHS